MSPAPEAGGEQDWRLELKQAIRSRRALLAALALPGGEDPAAAGAEADFPVLVPRGFAARMEPGNPRDPLLLQVLADPRESEPFPGFGSDPNRESDAGAGSPGVLCKYEGRALLLAAGACAVNCRYCFRRHFPYEDHRLSRGDLESLVAALLANPGTGELILSGGDPLLLDDHSLARLAAIVATHAPATRLRVHTRLPIVIPARVTTALCAALATPQSGSVVVVHCNHARELDGKTRAALRRLRQAGITVLNQSVLLAGVNDSADTLVELSEALFGAGVLPYYLHMLDPVAGAAHFAVEEDRARRLVGAAAARLPGYLVPRLAREIPGARAKVVLAPSYASGDES